jgi:hypothetical protein
MNSTAEVAIRDKNPNDTQNELSFPILQYAQTNITLPIDRRPRSD